jgi:hypothetical protein
LIKPANKNGGDRYEATLPDKEVFVIYFPQSISRKSGSAQPSLDVTIN